MDPGKGQAVSRACTAETWTLAEQEMGCGTEAMRRWGGAGRGRDGSVAPREVFAPLPRDRSP